ncbi:hypothetical protein PCIT_b0084 [Pseudoalteromonas citrea]|uniref:DJ-1/PfpI domain-containing protein n=2 Tax=Pseudoalteromonas citrea TaxID=43655 RepID=A0AAD4FPN0_9GAMM|nr:type 1 glutamine amidotransferase domain-containing protein [Pseudoalteromonas citrea]KAF7764162.1 hypothetical protein PCIT_b0084 [Pseudoalteromonas citrea]
MKKVIIFVTNHATLGSTDQANGTYAPELTHVVNVLNGAGIDYDIASILGGKAPLYGTEPDGDEVNQSVLGHSGFVSKVENTLLAASVSIDDYDAVFYPGGFGLLNDLFEDITVAALSAQHYENGGVIAAVCHGPAGLLPIKLSNGELLLSSVSVTGFTREEEVDFGTINDIPFLLEDALARKAVQYSKKQPWQSFVVEDKRVITGQNPASAQAVGEALVKYLA